MDALSAKPDFLNAAATSTPTESTPSSINLPEPDKAFADVASEVLLEQTETEEISGAQLEEEQNPEEALDTQLTDNNSFFDINLLLALQKSEEKIMLLSSQKDPSDTQPSDLQENITTTSKPENTAAQMKNMAPPNPLLNQSENKATDKDSDIEAIVNTLEIKPLNHSFEKNQTTKTSNASETNPFKEIATLPSLDTDLTIKPKFSDESEPNKYVNALTQMSQVINAQTTRYAQRNNEANLNSTSISYADTLKNKSNQEFELNIQTLPTATLNSINKESYHASIKIYPPELGQVIAKLKINGNNTELVIQAENNVVKQIVEASLSQLRDSFQQSDINLTTVMVETTHADAKQQNKNQQPSQAFAESPSNNEINQEDGHLVKKISSRSLDSIIDTYA